MLRWLCDDARNENEMQKWHRCDGAKNRRLCDGAKLKPNHCNVMHQKPVRTSQIRQHSCFRKDNAPSEECSNWGWKWRGAELTLGLGSCYELATFGVFAKLKQKTFWFASDTNAKNKIYPMVEEEGDHCSWCNMLHYWQWTDCNAIGL